MNFYSFPSIKTIDDVLPHIDGHNEFRVIEKDDMLIVNYFVRNDDTFRIDPNNPLKGIIQRECRGLLFSKSGKIIGRRYHKFFNVNELEETQERNINLNIPHVILDKLDGSMVSPVLINGDVILTTKLGITDTSIQSQKFLNTQPDIKDFCELLLLSGINPIFEWLDENFVHQIKHPNSQLVVTGIRNIESGRYFSYEFIKYMCGNICDIPFVKKFQMDHTISEIANNIKSLEDTEGVVIRSNALDNVGHMIKIKTDWYLERARIFDMIRFEKDVIRLIASQKDDDVIGLLEKNLQKKYKQYRNTVLKKVEEWAEKIEKQLEVFLLEGKPENRKQFHEIVSIGVDKQLLPYYLKYMGDIMEGEKIKQKLFEYMLDQLDFYSSTTTRLEKNVKWMYEDDWVRYL